MSQEARDPRLSRLPDPDRLAAIARAGIRDPRIRSAMNRWADLLARIVNAPVAQVNVVTDREKIPVGHAGRDDWRAPVGLERSFCQYVVASGEPLVVSDARTHPLLRDNPATTEGGVVAYVSAPLTLEGGYTLGSLCAVDFRERTWTRDEVDALLDLADAVVAEVERAAAERALRESEARFRSVQEFSPQGFALMDAVLDAEGQVVDFRHRYVNPAAERLLGRGAADLVGHAASEAYPDGIGAELVELFARSMRTGAPEQREITFGEPGTDPWAGRWFEITIARLEDGVGVTFTDITARRQAEAERERLLAELRQSEQLLKAVLDQMPSGVAVAEAPSGRLLYHNVQAERLLGHAMIVRDDYRGYAEYGALHADGTPYAPEKYPIARALLNEEVVQEDMRYRRPDGSGIELLVSAAPVYDDRDRMIAAVSTFDDISERSRAERALRESEARFRLLVDASPELMWLNQPDGTAIYHNRSYQEYTGFSRDELVAGLWRETIHPQDRPEVEAAREEGLAAGEPYEMELRIRRGNGEFCWHRARVVPARGEDGAITAWIGAAANIDDVFRARALAEEANRAKSEFLATMSHEIRTPINAVMGYVDLMETGLGGTLSETHQRYLQRIKSSSQHLLGLINDVLDLAKVEAGRMTLATEPFDVNEMIEEAVYLVRPQAERAGLMLECASRPAAVQGDAARVRQILLNLLSNAVKFTDAGGHIVLRWERADPAAEGAELAGDGEWLAVRVEDTGMGIPAEQVSRLFQPFMQVEQGHTRTRGGTGLGLAISRRLARLMGGDLTVRSEAGRGSTFTLWLPAHAHPQGEGGGSGPRRLDIAAWVAEHAEEIANEWALLLRAERLVPHVEQLSTAQLKDHVASYLSDLAGTLRMMEDPGADADSVLRDAGAIHRLIAERHGQQRRRLGWTEEAIRREHALLADTLKRMLERRVGGGVQIDLSLFHRFLADAEEVSVRAFRHGTAGGVPEDGPGEKG